MVGAILAVLVLSTLGGMLYLALLQMRTEVTYDDPLVTVHVTTPESVLYTGVLGADTALEAMEKAGAAANFTVTVSEDGRTLVSAAGRENGPDGRWTVGVARAGSPTNATLLQPDDVVRWVWTPAAAPEPEPIMREHGEG